MLSSHMVVLAAIAVVGDFDDFNGFRPPRCAWGGSAMAGEVRRAMGDLLGQHLSGLVGIGHHHEAWRSAVCVVKRGVV